MEEAVRLPGCKALQQSPIKQGQLQKKAVAEAASLHSCQTPTQKPKGRRRWQIPRKGAVTESRPALLAHSPSPSTTKAMW